MKTWRVVAGSHLDGMKLMDEAPASLQSNQVRVRLRAASLNFRDTMVSRGMYPNSSSTPLVPGSDGAGDVIETGGAVTRFKVGDRVTTSFFPDWIEGPPTPQKVAGALGGGGAGTFAQEIVLAEHSLIRSPHHLGYAQAATLTCAGVTAWRALFVAAQVRPGETVLLLGTGGVSIWALQLAKAAGARVIITSSSDVKLARARELGADEVINYTNTPEWSGEVRRLTHGMGVDAVLEVGGEKTIGQSLASVRMDGTIVIIGAVSGVGGAILPRQLITGSTRVQGVYVGSRSMHEELARFVELTQIVPVVDRMFPLEEAPDAYTYFLAGRHFGKVGLLCD
ncbi:MAG: NAD(P)-dependent alcohol dehydrogenase [Pseudomonadota bacterium]